jgi:anti-sigma factor RsiW
MPTGLSCREIIDFLAAYLDGELAPPVREDFEAHLALCPDCVGYLESYRETLRLARDSRADDDEACREVPEELLRAILASRRPA